MDFCMKKASAARCDTLYEGNAEQSVDCEINLPDYCSDIRRILKCSAEVNIKACQQTGERLTVDGDIVLRLLYVNENEQIDCHEHTVPLSRYVEVKSLGNSFCVYTKASVEYLNCRASSQRRISVNGKVAIRITVVKTDDSELVCSAQGGGVQTLARELSMCKTVAMSDKVFDMNETVSLSDDEPAVGGVIFCGAQAVPSGIKAISGKLLIKGDLTAQIVYFSDDAQRNVISKKHTMPISQIAELNGIDDKSDCPVDLDVISVQIQPKSDSSGANRLLEISCRVATRVKAYETENVCFISDCYCIGHDMQSEYTTLDFITAHARYDEEKTVRSVIEAGSEGISKPLEMWCKGISSYASYADGKIDGKACADICLLYLDAAGKPVYTEKPVDISFGSERQLSGNRANCKTTAILKEAVFSKVGADKIEIRLSVIITVDICESEAKRVCSEISVNEDEALPLKKSALTAYFCEEGEQIWDIAKNYSTSVEAISAENGISSDEALHKGMLMIPMCS